LVEAVDRLGSGDDFLGKVDRLLELIDWPRTFPKVWGILGWNIHSYYTQVIVTPPEDEEFKRAKHRRGWHQDSDRINADIAPGPQPRISVKVGYFLTDLTKGGHGNFSVIPGSHLKREIELPADGVSDPEEAIEIRVPTGTAVIFDRRLFHARGWNLSDTTRKVLFVGYSHRWIHPRDERTVEHIMEGSDPIRRQLLGAKTRAMGTSSPSDEDVPLRFWIKEHLGEDIVTDNYARIVGAPSVTFGRNHAQ
ncbi:hypothetical protein F4X33_19555, partial [Candidatus Poribacteria bacterium]|nr:hypothetical protein [Candidatus Poribacteria bacterium]